MTKYHNNEQVRSDIIHLPSKHVIFENKEIDSNQASSEILPSA